MKKQHRFSIWYAILGVWLVLLLHKLGQLPNVIDVRRVG